jgi:uncharacterized short protein YbdD (DUF466 family)
MSAALAPLRRLLGELAPIGARMRDSARLMAGLPSYEAYLAHARAAHPDREPMSYAQFVRDRQDARYGAGGKGGFRCC